MMYTPAFGSPPAYQCRVVDFFGVEKRLAWFPAIGVKNRCSAVCFLDAVEITRVDTERLDVIVESI